MGKHVIIFISSWVAEGFESNRTSTVLTIEMSGHRWFNIFPRPSLQETDTPTGDTPSEALLTRICQVPFFVERLSP